MIMRLTFLVGVSLASVALGDNTREEFYLKSEFEQLKSILGKEDPEMVQILKALEKPRNWDALMHVSNYLPSKHTSDLFTTLLGLKDTILPPLKKKKTMEDSEGEDMQKVFEMGVSLENHFFAGLEDRTEEIAAHLIRWFLHLKKYESFWIRRHYNVQRLQNTLKYLVRRIVGLYAEVKGDGAEAEVTRTVLEELNGEIGERWEWQWIAVLAFTGVLLFLLLLSIFVFYLRFRRRK